MRKLLGLKENEGGVMKKQWLCLFVIIVEEMISLRHKSFSLFISSLSGGNVFDYFLCMIMSGSNPKISHALVCELIPVNDSQLSY